MPYSRALILLGVIAAAGLGVVFLARAPENRPADPIRAPAAAPAHVSQQRTGILPRLRGTLAQALQQLAASRQRIASPRLGRVVPLAPGGQTCFVGAGTCSETPCVIPVRSGSGPVVTATPAVASMVTATPAPAGAGRHAGAPGPAVVVPSPSRPEPRQGCPSGRAGPQTLRVSTP